jgi:hypothetical protein
LSAPMPSPTRVGVLVNATRANVGRAVGALRRVVHVVLMIALGAADEVSIALLRRPQERTFVMAYWWSPMGIWGLWSFGWVEYGVDLAQLPPGR